MPKLQSQKKIGNKTERSFVRAPSRKTIKNETNYLLSRWVAINCIVMTATLQTWNFFLIFDKYLTGKWNLLDAMAWKCKHSKVKYIDGMTNEIIVHGWQKILENITSGYGHHEWKYWIHHEWPQARVISPIFSQVMTRTTSNIFQYFWPAINY